MTTPMTHPQTPATFCIWLQGFLEGCGTSLNPGQLTTLKTKLDTVFTHPEPGPDHAILTGESEADTATGDPDPLLDKYWKMLEEYEKRKADKWVYDGPPIPKTWPHIWPYPHYPPEGPGRWWPTPAINC
jgi:hypothetical protein